MISDSMLLPESQYGFRMDRGTTEMKITARQLQEKCQEQNLDLYKTFVDLTKAFDTVIRERFCKIMAKFACPAKFIWCSNSTMVCLQGSKMMARFLIHSLFKWIKQGCVLASILFSMMFSAMPTDAFKDGDNGISIRYRFDGKLFILRRFQANRYRQRCKMSFSLLMIWLRVHQQKRRCKKVWIKYLIHVAAMISQSASRWYISQHLESLTRSLSSQWKVNACKW